MKVTSDFKEKKNTWNINTLPFDMNAKVLIIKCLLMTTKFHNVQENLQL